MGKEKKKKRKKKMKRQEAPIEEYIMFLQYNI